MLIENVGRPLVGLLTGNEDFYDNALETHKGPPYIFYIVKRQKPEVCILNQENNMVDI